MSHSTVVAYKYTLPIANGALLANEAALDEINGAVQIAERSGDAFALALVNSTLGIAVMYGDQAGREHGLRVHARMREWSLQRRFSMTMIPVFDMYAAREKGRRGGYGDAVPVLRAAVGNLFSRAALLWCIPGTRLLVETLLERGASEDLAEADAAISRLVAAPTDDGLVRKM